MTPLVRIRSLKKYYPINDGFFSQKTKNLKAVDDISFNLLEGELSRFLDRLVVAKQLWDGCQLT